MPDGNPFQPDGAEDRMQDLRRIMDENAEAGDALQDLIDALLVSQGAAPRLRRRRDG